jgi:hypothetical protein
MPNTSNDCSGCYTYMTRMETPGLTRIPQYCCNGEISNCPCLICIVKSMCYTECEDFMKFKQKKDNSYA